jgi:hypothetical protein
MTAPQGAMPPATPYRGYRIQHLPNTDRYIIYYQGHGITVVDTYADAELMIDSYLNAP